MVGHGKIIRQLDWKRACSWAEHSLTHSHSLVLSQTYQKKVKMIVHFIFNIWNRNVSLPYCDDDFISVA